MAVAVTVREVDAAHTAVPVDTLVPGETTTCLSGPQDPWAVQSRINKKVS